MNPVKRENCIHKHQAETVIIHWRIDRALSAICLLVTRIIVRRSTQRCMRIMTVSGIKNVRDEIKAEAPCREFKMANVCADDGTEKNCFKMKRKAKNAAKRMKH